MHQLEFRQQSAKHTRPVPYPPGSYRFPFISVPCRDFLEMVTSMLALKQGPFHLSRWCTHLHRTTCCTNTTPKGNSIRLGLGLALHIISTAEQCFFVSGSLICGDNRFSAIPPINSWCRKLILVQNRCLIATL